MGLGTLAVALFSAYLRQVLGHWWVDPITGLGLECQAMKAMKKKRWT